MGGKPRAGHRRSRDIADEGFDQAQGTVFRDDDEAVMLANSTTYGLTAAIRSQSVTRALHMGRRLKTAMVHINDQTVHDEPYAPFGGRGASGNGARFGRTSNYEQFTQWRWITIAETGRNFPY